MAKFDEEQNPLAKRVIKPLPMPYFAKPVDISFKMPCLIDKFMKTRNRSLVKPTYLQPCMDVVRMEPNDRKYSTAKENLQNQKYNIVT